MSAVDMTAPIIVHDGSNRVDSMGFQDQNTRVLKKHKVFEWHLRVASNLYDLFDVISWFWSGEGEIQEGVFSVPKPALWCFPSKSVFGMSSFGKATGVEWER